VTSPASGNSPNNRRELLYADCFRCIHFSSKRVPPLFRITDLAATLDFIGSLDVWVAI
jgi:hypothetical protein